MIDKYEDPEKYQEVKGAIDVLFRQLLKYGDNFMRGQLFADGEFYILTVKIRKVVEGEEDKKL